MTRSDTLDESHCSCIYYLLQSDCKLIPTKYDSIPPLEENYRYLQRREVYGVYFSDSEVVIPLLLILAGDIEVNPGPGENIQSTTISYVVKKKKSIPMILCMHTVQ